MDKRDCKINYKCPKAWDDLDKTEDPFVRFCNQCEKDVHFCADVESLKEATIENLCVAVPTDDFEDGVMMGDIDWSGFESDPLPLEPPEPKLDDADLSEGWVIDDKPQLPDFQKSKPEKPDMDSWLEGELDDPLDPLSLEEKPK
ncbi:hypothetical protein ACMXYW_10385 [Neptuniibacter sp. QD48_55]|uniref:hypothetical protein n=1 Tax=Neptuniibacter sp. QD48_55 TaxID=3398212 RepID=UPI0039F524B3